jgi:hypothetical protein
MHVAKKKTVVGCQWLRPVVLASKKPEIRRIEVQSHPQPNSFQYPILKILNMKKG